MVRLLCAGQAPDRDHHENERRYAALADPSVHGRLGPLGYESRPDALESVGAFLRAEVEIWSRVIKQAGIGPEK
jgi:hypothetical protein